VWSSEPCLRKVRLDIKTIRVTSRELHLIMKILVSNQVLPKDPLILKIAKEFNPEI